MLRAATATVLLLAAPAAFGQAGALQQAEAAYDELDFDRAARLFGEALKAPAGRQDRIRAYRGLALSLAFVGGARAAQRQFETLLLLDPDATVNRSLGPKISRPFAAAKKAIRGRTPKLHLERDDRTGEVTASLRPQLEAADAVVLQVTPEGGPTQTATAPAGGAARLEVPPHLAVEARAQVTDPGQGVLFESGPTAFRATVRPAAVAMALDDAHRGDEVQPEPARRWPLWVGGAVAVVGGGVAAFFLTRPEPLNLPSADRVGRLP